MTPQDDLEPFEGTWDEDEADLQNMDDALDEFMDDAVLDWIEDEEDGAA